MSVRAQIIRERIGLAQALELVDAVRRADRDQIRDLIDLADTPAVIVTLAAMVDDERTAAQMLAWTSCLPHASEGERAARTLGPAPHGTHASFNRHKAKGERPCVRCVEGERLYQRLRARRRRAEKITASA